MSERSLFTSRDWLSRLKIPELFPIWLFVFLVLANMPSLYHEAMVRRISYCMGDLGKICFEAIIICLPLAFIRNRWIRYIWAAPFVLVASTAFILDFYAIYQYGHLFNAGMMDVAVSTNYHEAMEFLEQFVPVYCFVVIFASLLLAFKVALWFDSKVAKKYAHNKFVIAIIVILVVKNVVSIGKYGFADWREEADRAFSVMRLTNIVLTTNGNIKQYELYESGRSAEDIKITRNESDIPYVVFVLGESTSRNHMSLYGYELDTSPLLKKRAEEGGMYVFSDVISHHSHTLPVMREIFSFYRRDTAGKWFQSANIFDILQKTDYRTMWFSNQESSGAWSLDKYYSKRCDWKYFTEVRDNTEEGTVLDGELLAELKNADYGSKNFIVVHLMGTHSSYSRRYPEDFGKFKAADEMKGADDRQKETRAQYDNAVLYNDYVVDSIIDMFKDKDAVVIYVSDHAEEVYEDRDFVGHTESEGTKHMIEIPMLIWTSQTFRKNRPDLARRMSRSAEHPFMTDDMIHVLLDILSIETNEYDSTKSLINDKYTPSERIYNGKVYEKPSIGN